MKRQLSNARTVAAPRKGASSFASLPNLLLVGLIVLLISNWSGTLN